METLLIGASVVAVLLIGGLILGSLFASITPRSMVVGTRIIEDPTKRYSVGKFKDDR